MRCVGPFPCVTTTETGFFGSFSLCDNYGNRFFFFGELR